MNRSKVGGAFAAFAAEVGVATPSLCMKASACRSGSPRIATFVAGALLGAARSSGVAGVAAGGVGWLVIGCGSVAPADCVAGAATAGLGVDEDRGGRGADDGSGGAAAGTIRSCVSSAGRGGGTSGTQAATCANGSNNASGAAAGVASARRIRRSK